MALCIHTMAHVIWTYGLPHSVIRASQDICSYTRLFAAYHDLDVWVTPFGDPRITGYLLLHAAFRSLSRPSSSASSKASAVDPFLLDHIIFMTLLYYLSKNKRIGGTGIRTLDPRLAKPML